jgi:flavin reductase (DIM6/NTAB) family NADH-FMN oxidoreductase RutF
VVHVEGGVFTINIAEEEQLSWQRCSGSARREEEEEAELYLLLETRERVR